LLTSKIQTPQIATTPSSQNKLNERKQPMYYEKTINANNKNGKKNIYSIFKNHQQHDDDDEKLNYFKLNSHDDSTPQL
jgi:uncharacterized protein YxeA